MSFTNVLFHLNLLIEKRAEYMYLLRKFRVLLSQFIEPESESSQKQLASDLYGLETPLLERKLDQRIVEVLTRSQPLEVRIRNIDSTRTIRRINQNAVNSISLQHICDSAVGLTYISSVSGWGDIRATAVDLVERRTYGFVVFAIGRLMKTSTSVSNVCPY